MFVVPDYVMKEGSSPVALSVMVNVEVSGHVVLSV